VTPAFRSKLRVEDEGGFPFTLLEPLVYDSAVLREAMECCGVSRAQRWMIYTGLRVGGGLVWRRYRNGGRASFSP